jgi:predicted Rdx family selenoprotein
MCENCEVECNGTFCQACTWLANAAGFRRRRWGETEGTVNRRWQMRFNRGELPEVHVNAGVRWERKRALQDW